MVGRPRAVPRGGRARDRRDARRGNGMMNDRLTVGGDSVHLSDIPVPFLTVRANRDHIVPPDATAPLIDLVGSADKHELLVSTPATWAWSSGAPRRGRGAHDHQFIRNHCDPVYRARCRRRRPEISVVELGPALRSLLPFFTEIFEVSSTFVKEEVIDPGTGCSWTRMTHLAVTRWMASTATMTGYVAVRPLPG